MPATLEVPSSTFRWNSELREIVALDETERRRNPTLFTLTVIAAILWCDVSLVSRWLADEIAMPEEAWQCITDWRNARCPAGKHWLLCNSRTHGTRGSQKEFVALMDRKWPRRNGVLAYYEAAAILGVNQWQVFAWYWGDAPVPQAAIDALRAAFEDTFEVLAPYALGRKRNTEGTRISHD